MDPEQLKGSLKKLAKDDGHKRARHHKKSTRKHINPQAFFSWEAPVRAYKKKSAGVLRFYAAIAILLSLIVVFFREYILVIPIWAVMFLTYVLTITPPNNIRHTFTKFGIQSAGNTYLWEDLSHFYFIKKFDYYIAVIFSKYEYDVPLYLVITDEKTQEAVLHHLSDHLIYMEEPQKTLTDKMAEWLTTLMPEEENRAASSKPEGRPLSHRTFSPSE